MNNNRKKGDANSFFEKAVELHKQHKKDEAIKFIDKSIDLNKEKNNLIDLAESIYYKGIIYHESGHDTDEALNYFEEALLLYKKVNNFEGIGKALYNIGWTNRDLGNYVKALKYTKENLELQQKLDNKEKIAWAHVSIGWVYTAQKEFDLAEREFQKSIEFFEELKDDRGKAFAQRFRATSLKHNARNKIAMKYLQECFKLFEKQENKWQLAITLNEIAEIYEEDNKLNNAIENYLKMLDFVKELEKVDIVANIQAHLVGLYLITNEKEKAESCLLQLEKLAADTKFDSIKKQYSNAKEVFTRKKNT